MTCIVPAAYEDNGQTQFVARVIVLRFLLVKEIGVNQDRTCTLSWQWPFNFNSATKRNPIETVRGFSSVIGLHVSPWLLDSPMSFWDWPFFHDRMCVIATSLLVYRFLMVSSQCSFPLPSHWGPIVIWPITSSEVRRSWFMTLIVIEYSWMVSPSISNKKPWFQTGFTPRVFLVCLVSSIASFAFRSTQTYGAVKTKMPNMM